jgi:hypothetical protein
MCPAPLCLYAAPWQVVNVTPRYAKLLDSKGSVFGWENMELISGAPCEAALRPACSSSFRCHALIAAALLKGCVLVQLVLSD